MCGKVWCDNSYITGKRQMIEDWLINVCCAVCDIIAYSPQSVKSMVLISPSVYNVCKCASMCVSVWIKCILNLRRPSCNQILVLDNLYAGTYSNSTLTPKDDWKIFLEESHFAGCEQYYSLPTAHPNLCLCCKIVYFHQNIYPAQILKKTLRNTPFDFGPLHKSFLISCVENDSC